MVILVTPTFAELRGRIPVQYVDQLEHILRYRPEGYQHSFAFKLHRWDGYISLLKRQGDRILFPAGSLYRAVLLAEKLGVPVEYEEIDLTRLEPALTTGSFSGLPERLRDGTALYPDQVEALRCAVQHQRGLLALATNFGKTELAAAIFATFPDSQGLLIVNRRPLLTQTADRLEQRLGYAVGAWGAGRRPGRQTRITVAMIQTLYRHRRKPEVQRLLSLARMLIVDEVHTVTPKTWYPILGACRAPFRIGMSGTVKEVHNLLPVEAFFGPVLMEVKEAQLVAAGRSAQPTILMPNAGALIGDTKDYGVLYLEGIVRNEGRNQLLIDTVRWAAQRRLRTLMLFYRIEHGEQLYKLLELAGVRASLLHGQTPPWDIEAAKRALSERQLDVIVASTIFNQGVDLPAVEVLINAAAWRSPLATSQKLGRGLRRKLEGLNQVLVVDPYDLGSRMLKRHSESRLRTYERRGFHVLRGDLQALLEQIGGVAMRSA